MHSIPKIFFRWPTTILFMTVVPIFFLVFSIVYHPLGIDDFLDMGRGLFAFNVSIIFAIILALESGMRVAFHFFKNLRITWAVFVSWCIGEVLVFSLFVSMFVSLMSRGELPYFTALFKFCLPYLFLVLIIPYIILTLAFDLSASKEARDAVAAQGDDTLVRFFDMYKKPKLLIAASAVLYIQAEENYVSIWYLDSGRAVKYSLRASMNSLEKTCSHHGLVRCQRSYYVNPDHVTILRKEKGLVYADLDIEGVQSIPVSKNYYDKLQALL